MVSEYCPRALDFYDAKEPYDRSIFAVGVAAHAFLEAEAAAADVPGGHADFDAVAIALATKGRSFDGDPEPPMPAEAVEAGRALALSWLEEHPIDFDCTPEKGYAVNKDWQAVKYSSPDAYYKGILDLVYDANVEEEEYSMSVVVARDYKSSWRDGAATLDSTQMKGQALLLRAVHPDVQAIRLEVANLRTGGIYGKTILLDEEGEALFARWRQELDLAIAASDARREDGLRPARPGSGCLGCPYLLRCEEARGYMRGTVLAEQHARQAVGIRLAVAEAMVAELTKAAKVLAAEEPILLPTGYVGYKAQVKRKVRDEGIERMAMAWFDTLDDKVLGFLKAIGLGATAVDKASKVLHPFTRGDTEWKAKREAFVESILTDETVSTFGVHHE
jgi:hypothetical protein